jgi:mannose-6-phosphate isomerase-like protein (cupin superfamily)
MFHLRWHAISSCAICLLAAFSLARGLPAQTRGMAPAEIISARRLNELGDSLTPLGSKSAQLGRGANFSYAIWRRDTSGGLERHERFADILVVQSGSATILSGGHQDGATESSPGEWRGGTARGATRQTIRAGDVVTTPAGTPHQMLLAPGERITYITIKVAATP